MADQWIMHLESERIIKNHLQPKHFFQFCSVKWKSDTVDPLSGINWCRHWVDLRSPLEQLTSLTQIRKHIYLLQCVRVRRSVGFLLHCVFLLSLISCSSDNGILTVEKHSPWRAQTSELPWHRFRLLLTLLKMIKEFSLSFNFKVESRKYGIFCIVALV